MNFKNRFFKNLHSSDSEAPVQKLYEPDPNSELENGQFDTARFERMKSYVAQMKKNSTKKLTEIPLDFAMKPNPEPRKTKFVKDLGDIHGSGKIIQQLNLERKMNF